MSRYCSREIWCGTDGTVILLYNAPPPIDEFSFLSCWWRNNGENAPMPPSLHCSQCSLHCFPFSSSWTGFQWPYGKGRDAVLVSDVQEFAKPSHEKGVTSVDIAKAFFDAELLLRKRSSVGLGYFEL